MSRLPPPAGKPTNAICVPSGDHEGSVSIVGPGRQVHLAGAIGVHHPDVRASAAAAPIERDPRAVGRPRRVPVDVVPVRDALHGRAVRRDHVDLREPPRPRARERDPRAVGRPRRRQIVRRVAPLHRQLPVLRPVRVHHEEAERTTRFGTAGVHDLRAVRRPRRISVGAAFRVSAPPPLPSAFITKTSGLPPARTTGRTRRVRHRATRRDPSPGRCSPRGSIDPGTIGRHGVDLGVPVTHGPERDLPVVRDEARAFARGGGESSARHRQGSEERERRDHESRGGRPAFAEDSQHPPDPTRRFRRVNAQRV